LYNDLPEILGKLLFTYLHSQLETDEVNGESWQLVTAGHGEDDGLMLCE
jgi:hypothetical protein